MKTRVVISRILFVIYLCAVAYLCLHTFDNQPKIPFTIWGLPSDKVIHFFMFFPFPFMAYISYDKRIYTNARSWMFAGATLLLGVIVAGITEIAQMFTETRSAEWSDYLADCLALLVMTLIILAVDIIHNSHYRKK